MGDKWQAIHDFWSGFDLPAYDETDVPDDAEMPYITYSAQIGAMDSVLGLTGNLWYKSTSWAEISRKALQIAHKLSDEGYYLAKVDGGYLMMVQGTPFSQRMSDEDDSVRRIYFNVEAEFLTAV